MLREDWYLRERLKFRQLHLLTVLCRLRHISSAAELLHTSQPAVSKSLADLERILGARLFDRKPSGLVPTKICLALVDRAREIFRTLGRMREDVASMHSDIEGVINVGVSTSASVLLLPHVLQRMRPFLPKVTVAVHEGSLPSLLDALRSLTLDFAVVHQDDNTRTSDLEETPLFDMQMVMVCRTGHPALRRSSLTLMDIAQWPWILPLQGSSTRNGLEQMFQQLGTRPESAGVECMSFLANAVMLRNSDALAAASVPTAELFESAGMLARLPLELPPLFGRIALFRSKGKDTAAKDEHFIRCVTEAAEELEFRYKMI